MAVCRKLVEETRLEVEACKQASKQGEARLNVTRRAVSLSCEAIIEQFAAARCPMFDSADGEEASWSLQTIFHHRNHQPHR